MHVYFSGIGGAGLGPLALLALDCGYEVSGSDLNESPFTKKIEARGVRVSLSNDSSKNLHKVHQKNPVDWIVYTSALPDEHPELAFAAANSIRNTKRDEFVNHVIKDKKLKMIAVSGTHGKTTTSAMLVWLFNTLKMPVSYQVGTNLPWGPSAEYVEESEYFVYEADEYDRNMLHFHPLLSVIPSLDYDHPDTYPTQDDYSDSFRKFTEQSKQTLAWESIKDNHNLTNSTVIADDTDISSIKLAGVHMRKNAFLAVQAFKLLHKELTEDELVAAISKFPGTQRRFEKIKENLYTDYAHHPTELSAVMQMALELSDDVVVVYQPHHDKRQQEVFGLYADVFRDISKLYWLPTYEPAGRGDDNALSPEQLIVGLSNSDVAQPAQIDNDLKQEITEHLSSGSLVLACSAGSLDNWLRKEFS
ncbi:hypothetical protein KBF61_02190 [Candidatus Saccharibacteria bacterium]|jgi:UDP-N-acetylmuramate--alanine ligase|nr:hypothetical protein [Candidatus Saccharibacteria bacterium]